MKSTLLRNLSFDIADAEVSFISSNTEIATVNENGKIIINGVGPFSITVSISDPVVVANNWILLVMIISMKIIF